MIRRLALRNWRAYDHLELVLPAGTTFVVAPNGVGKSSLFEAACFAIFGSTPRRPGAHRAGASGPTTAEVDIELSGERVLTVSRELSKTKKSKAPTALIDGNAMNDTELAQTFLEEFGASPVFLERLSMLSGSDVIGAGGNLDVRDHLSRFFGIDGIDRNLETISQHLKSAQTAVADARTTGPVSADDIRILQEAASLARAELSRAEIARKAAEEQLRTARLQTSAALNAVDQRQRAEVWSAGLANAATEVSDLLGESVGPHDVEARLDLAEQTAREELDAVRRRRSELQGEIDAMSRALRELGEVEGSCPVCRRPLAPADLDAARHAHEDDIDRIRSEQESLDEADLQARVVALTTLRGDVLRLGADPGPVPESVAVEEAQAGESRAVTDFDDAVTTAAQARAAAGQAESALDAANEAAADVVRVARAFERQATLEATSGALKEARRRLLDEGVEPLADSLSEQWAQLFGGRAGLELAGDGELFRRVGDQRLGERQFSDGERMASQLLLRLLVLQNTTTLPFLWIDEPLEHLDPDVRRGLSMLLSESAGVGSPGPLRQIVVTTYEEPLVRRLTAALPDITVRYVRAI